MNKNQNYNSPHDYSHLYGGSAPQLSEPVPVYESPKRSEPPPKYASLKSDYKNSRTSSSSSAPAPKPPKPKQPFSPISLLLVAGVIFLFLGGVIFLTNTWKALPDALRAVSLLSASVVAFGANMLAERVFRLRKTGLAFYILGCIFLPLALGGIGVFDLLGKWFSFHGDGASLLWMVIFISISASTYLGQKNYKNTVLVWLALAGIAGGWISFSIFVSNQVLEGLPVQAQVSIFGVLIVAYAIGSAVVCERYFQNHQESYVTKAIPSYLYIVNLVTSLFMLAISKSDGKIAACILSLIMAVLFCNYRFIEKKFHLGLLGSGFCMMTALYQISSYFDNKIDIGIFMITVCSVVFMSLLQMPKLRTEFTQTYSKAGILLSCTLIFPLSFEVAAEQEDLIFWLLYPLLMIAVIFYAKAEKNKLSQETGFHIAHICLLFLIAEHAFQTESDLSVLGLVISALILLIVSIIRKQLWTLTTAILASGAALLLNFDHADVSILWLCAAGLLGGMIYANQKWRFLLEKCCAWALIAFFTTALQGTLVIWTERDVAWILTLAASGLLYLLETFVFWRELRRNETRPYLEFESLILSIIAFGSYLIHDTSAGFGFLLCILLLIFSAGFLRKDVNIIAVPQLIMLFATVSHLVGDMISQAAGVICYLVLLVLYAAMGRLLLPYGFYHHEGNKTQIDWALLAGALPVFGVAVVVDWYPSILVCLFLAIYSLLYIGRVQNRFIPTLMASAFSCLTILFHNINDPFEIFSALHDSEMKTPQVLLYLLPFHLFILSLLWILPEKFKKTVHNARFAMYCLTMFCLLCVSLNFKVAADAILLMVFSFAILIGSFSVKKLRWFTLGFAILFLTTIRLTWKFWTSLHWGIYLFLAGILLIGIASYTEYKNRYYAEHPDEPKKKMDFFKTWTW